MYTFQQTKNIIRYHLGFQHRSYPLQRINGKKFCFIHINKNAGTSISNAIGLHHRMHFTVKDAINASSLSLYNSCFRFTVVRNPYDRIMSMYKYAYKMNEVNIKSNNIGFEEWILKTFRYKEKKYFFSDKILGTQTNYLTDFEGNINLELLMRFENIQEDFKLLKGALNLKKDLPHYNPSIKKDLSHYFYNHEILNTINEIFNDDFVNFNYKKINL